MVESQVTHQLRDLRDDLRARCPLVNVGPYYDVPVYRNAQSAMQMGSPPMRRIEGSALFAAWGEDYLTLVPLVLFEDDPRFGFWNVMASQYPRWGEQFWLMRPHGWFAVLGSRVRSVRAITVKHYPLLETLQ